MNQLVPINTAPPMPVSDVERIARAFAQSGMFGVRDASAAMSLCLLAQAEGQHPAIAFRDYSIIQGKPAKKAEAMQRDFLTSGGKIEWLELTDTCVKAKFSHPAGGSATVDWTMERARQAGLGGKDNWKKFPRQMLRSRVISEGVRTVCPMATSGMYVPEEVAEFGDSPTPVVDGGELKADPAPAKVEGITKIKQRIREMKARGDKANDAAEFEKIVAEYETECTTLCDAQHEWWTGKDRDGNEFEGVPAWLTRRRAELDQANHTLGYNMLVSCVNECESEAELQELLGKHDTAISELDGAESRAFEELCSVKSSAFKALETVRA